MKKSLVDVSVLLIFFTRHKQFKQVFEQVKKARPSELFLYQDGPRKGVLDDINNILKCREIAEDIDWDCKVHRLYQKKNIGVDPSGYLADTWAFSQCDKCIVLEDDVVPSVSFFSFCKVMLDKYEYDERVMLISGINIEEETPEVKEDYFFSSTTFTWGWASWARVVNNWDPQYSFLKDPYQKNRVSEYIKNKNLVKNSINIFQNHAESGVEHFETILISNQYLHQGLTLVPKKNMINNIGIVEDSAHYAGSISLIARGFRCVFTMKRFELNINEMTHPKTIKDYEQYRKKSFRIYAWGHPLIKLYRFGETLVYNIIKGNFKSVTIDIARNIKRLFTRTWS